MAKLPITKFSFDSDNGEKMEFASETNVSTDGEFYLSVPKELEDAGKAILKAEPKEYPCTFCGYRQRSEKLWVSGPNLDVCKQLIADAAKDYLKCEVVTERVIIYGAQIRVAVWKDDEGNYHPNGYHGMTGGWLKGHPGEFDIHATNRTQFYTVGLAARVADKITYTRPSGKKTVYKLINVHMETGTYLDKLNSFCALNIDLPGKGNMKEMPYSEKAARFFYEAMLGLCVMADKISMFLNDEERLQMAIESQTALLLPEKAD